MVGQGPARVGKTRAAVEFGALGNRHHVVGLGRRPGEHPAICGNTQRSGGTRRAKNQGSGLIHIPLRVVPFGVGPGQHPVAVGGRGNGRRIQSVPEPGIGIGRGHLGEAGPQIGHLGSVLLDGLTVGESAGIFDHGVVVGGHHQPLVDLGPADNHALGGHQLIGFDPTLVGIGSILTGDGCPQGPMLGLPTHHGHHIGGPRCDGGGGIAHPLSAICPHRPDGCEPGLPPLLRPPSGPDRNSPRCPW